MGVLLAVAAARAWSDSWTILAREAAGEAVALDEQFVYWARYASSSDWSSIERMPLAQ
jgi:hypothetical protein